MEVQTISKGIRQCLCHPQGRGKDHYSKGAVLNLESEFFHPGKTFRLFTRFNNNSILVSIKANFNKLRLFTKEPDKRRSLKHSTKLKV